MDGRYLTPAAEEQEKKLKERNFLRQFNTNFGEYKNIVNKYFYKRDKEETERLNKIQQPKFIYNNFPLLLGALFLIFGIFLIMSEFSSNDNKPQYGSGGAPTIVNATQPPQSLIKYVPIQVPVPVKSTSPPLLMSKPESTHASKTESTHATKSSTPKPYVSPGVKKTTKGKKSNPLLDD
jgi:hypothetical protein